MATKKVRPWGKLDKEKFHDLINMQQIDITVTSLSNIEQVRDIHFQITIATISARISVISRPLGTWKSSIAARNTTELKCNVCYC